MATDPNTIPPAVNLNIHSFELPESAGNFPVHIDISAIPPDTRLELLKRALTTMVSARVNTALSRFKTANTEWAAYDEAVAANAADPITNPVPTAPKTERPAAVDVAAKVSEAIAALNSGKLTREKSDKAPRARVAKDPVDAIVTGVVQRELFAKNKAANNSYKWTDAVKEVGASGVEYLKGRIDALVAGGADRTALEAMLENKYLATARIQAGISPLTGKKAELPNIL